MGDWRLSLEKEKKCLSLFYEVDILGLREIFCFVVDWSKAVAQDLFW